MDKKADVLVIGGARPVRPPRCACLPGYRPLIVERECFPRYHIGESMDRRVRCDRTRARPRAPHGRGWGTR